MSDLRIVTAVPSAHENSPYQIQWRAGTPPIPDPSPGANLPNVIGVNFDHVVTMENIVDSGGDADMRAVTRLYLVDGTVIDTMEDCFVYAIGGPVA